MSILKIANSLQLPRFKGTQFKGSYFEDYEPQTNQIPDIPDIWYVCYSSVFRKKLNMNEDERC